MCERAVDLSLTQRENKKEKRKREKEITSLGRQSSGKKQKASKPSHLNSHCHTLSSFFPSSTMPDREIGDDASDTNLSSSFSSFASSSSSFSSSYSAAGAWTDDHSAKMEKDPRKIARRFDFPTFAARFHLSVSLLSRFGFRTVSFIF